MAPFVCVEQVGSERVAAPVSLAPFRVEDYPHRAQAGSEDESAASPPNAGRVCTRAPFPSASEYSGIRLWNSAERHPQLEPGEVRAEAAVDPAAEREVGVRVTSRSTVSTPG